MTDKLSLKDYNRNMYISIFLSVSGVAVIFAAQYLGNSIIIMALGIIICIYAYIKAQMNLNKYRYKNWHRLEDINKKDEEDYKNMLKSREQ